MLERPEHGRTSELMERALNQFVTLVSRIASSVVDKPASPWTSSNSVLDMLASTFNNLSSRTSNAAASVAKENKQQQQQPTKQTWSIGKLSKKIRYSFSSGLTRAYDRLRRKLIGNTVDGQCQSQVSTEVTQLETHVKALQSKPVHNVDELNQIFQKTSELNKHSLQLNEHQQLFLTCQSAWADRVVRLLRWPLCSDGLPVQCLDGKLLQPWQLATLTSLELTCSNMPFAFNMEIASNETSLDGEEDELVIVEESVRAVDKDEQKEHQGLQLFIHGPPRPTGLKSYRMKSPRGLRGDDGSPDVEVANDLRFLQLTNNVRDLVAFVAAKPEYCDAPRLNGPDMPLMPPLPSLPLPQCRYEDFGGLSTLMKRLHI